MHPVIRKGANEGLDTTGAVGKSSAAGVTVGVGGRHVAGGDYKIFIGNDTQHFAGVVEVPLSGPFA